MIFVWGTKRKERKQGLVADFCPICRELRAFHLIRVGLAGHIYYVSFGEGKLAGHIIRCTACGVDLAGVPTRYLTAVKDPQADLEMLIRDTFPNLREKYSQRLEIETQIKRTRSALSGDDYKKFLMEPFALLNSKVEARFGRSTEMDKPAGIGCLGTILLAGGLFFVGALKYHEQGPVQDKILVAALIIGVIGMIYTFIQMHLGPGRYFQAKIMPPLVKALKPLEPTRNDLEECIERCKSLGLKIGKVAKAKQIGERLESVDLTAKL